MSPSAFSSWGSQQEGQLGGSHSQLPVTPQGFWGSGQKVWPWGISEQGKEGKGTQKNSPRGGACSGIRKAFSLPGFPFPCHLIII